MATEFQYTRLVLRNDSSAAWLASKDQILLKGEVGIEFLEDGTPKIKIGDGVKTWEQLGYYDGGLAEVIGTPAEGVPGTENYVGPTGLYEFLANNYIDTEAIERKELSENDENEFTLPTSKVVKDYVDEVVGKNVNTVIVTPKPLASGANHQEAIAGLIGENEPVAGDIAIVKETITGDKVAYTAYVYNGTGWAAMDGNYSAKNVYFDSSLTLTKTFGKYATSNDVPNVTINATGMSIYDLIMDAYSESKNPTKTDPKITKFNVTGNGNSTTNFEIGTTVTPEWDSTFSAGSYTYKSSVSNTTITPVSGTGVTATSWEVKQGDDKIGSTEKGKAGISFPIGDGNTTAISGSVGYSITANYSDGNYALTNLNTLPQSEVRITAGTTASVPDSLTWYRKMFGGGTSAETYTSDVIRGEDGTQAGLPTSTTPWVFKAVAGDAKIFYAYPKVMTTNTPKFEIFTMAWGETSGFTSSEVQVNDAAGKNPMTYTVWTYAPAGGFVAEETKYRVYF